MRWTVGIEFPVAVSLLALACTPASSPGGGTDGESDGSSGASTSDGGPTSGTMPTTTTTTASTTGDTGPGGDTTMGAATDSGDTSGVAPCPSNYKCLRTPPNGWAGPIAFEVGDSLDAVTVCGGAYDDELFAIDVDAIGSPPSCDCSCGQGDLSCGWLYVDDCATGSWVGASLGGGCADITYAAASMSAHSAILGDCGPASLSEMVADPTFTAAIRACGGAENTDDMCDPGFVCMPLPSNPLSGTMCIYAEGDVECPGAVYSQRNLYFRDFEDTRSCSDCSCGDSVEYCDVPGGVTILDPTNCGLGGSGSLHLDADGVCGPPTVNGGGVASADSFSSAAPVVPATACDSAPTGGTPQGEVTPTDAITVCCLP